MTDHELDRIAEDKAREHYQDPYSIALWSMGYCDCFYRRGMANLPWHERIIYTEGYNAGLKEKIRER